MNKIIDAMNWRYATKMYDTSKKLSESELDTVIDAGILSASSFGLQPYKIILVSDLENRKKLRKAAWDQPQVTDASHFVVLAARTDVDEKYVDNYVGLVAKTRGISAESMKGYSDMMKGAIASKKGGEIVDWAKKQAYIVLGTMLTASALAGIDSSPMEGFDYVAFDEILDLKKENLTTAVVLALGTRSKDDTYASLAKVRFPKKDIVVVK